MKKFRKYEFGSQGAATTKINALGVDEEGNPTPQSLNRKTRSHSSNRRDIR
jgi:hypothetical protein